MQFSPKIQYTPTFFFHFAKSNAWVTKWLAHRLSDQAVPGLNRGGVGNFLFMLSLGKKFSPSPCIRSLDYMLSLSSLHLSCHTTDVKIQ